MSRLATIQDFLRLAAFRGWPENIVLSLNDFILLAERVLDTSFARDAEGVYIVRFATKFRPDPRPGTIPDVFPDGRTEG